MPPDFNEADHERAGLLAQAECDHGVIAARTALGGEGEAFCVDCGVEIPEARRRVLPSARRCIICAGFVERGDT